MMRPLRRALLLVAFYLLTTAATAYAECAWVLWIWQGRDGREERWSPMWAHGTESECTRGAMDKVAFEAAQAKRRGENVELLGNMFVVKDSSGERFTRYVCFPDTVDPRGRR